MNLGLALSGGGFRATAYHLGVLARLAHAQRLEDVTYLSTVSGGSLCVGLVYALNGFAWPGSEAYLMEVAPRARRIMTTTNMQIGLLNRVLRAPWRLFQSKARVLSEVMQEDWGITIALRDLPPKPRWMINATCYETGKNWRFERFRMGDYEFGYTNDMTLPLADALAASAGFPGLIGPLVVDTSQYRWFKYRQLESASVSAEADAEVEQVLMAVEAFAMQPAGMPSTGGAPEGVAAAPESAPKTEPVDPKFDKIHLWDGGVYDNHGLEGLHDFMTGWRRGIDFLLVSDGAGKPTAERYSVRGVLMRIMTGVLMDQVRSLRTRAILERIRNHGDAGVYLTIGRSAEHILRGAGQMSRLGDLIAEAQSAAEAAQAGNFPTVIRQLKTDEFELLFRNGFEVADLSLCAYYPELFEHVPYTPVKQ